MPEHWPWGDAGGYDRFQVNLIVSGAGWSPNRDTFSRGRIFEYTDDALVARFKPEEQMDVDAISILPTLFVTETTLAGDQLARVGTITQLRLAGSKYQIEYAFDPAIPPMPIKFWRRSLVNLRSRTSSSVAHIGQ